MLSCARRFLRLCYLGLGHFSSSRTRGELRVPRGARRAVGEPRPQRGFSVNPWTTGSRFLLAHSLLTDEVYVAGLRDILGEFRSRALFILDEAHHAAPSGGAR